MSHFDRLYTEHNTEQQAIGFEAGFEKGFHAGANHEREFTSPDYDENRNPHDFGMWTEVMHEQAKAS